MSESALLDRVIEAADPARTPRDAQPDAAAMAMLDRIVNGEIEPPRDPHRGMRWVAAAAAVVVAAGAAFALTVPQGAAVAQTPVPLEFRAAGSVAQIIDDAHVALESSAGPPEPERLVRAASWGISVDMDTKRSWIEPQLSTLRWEQDLSGHMLIVAGEAYDPKDAVANATAEVRSTDRVITDLVIAPGEFGTPVVEPPGESEEAVRAMLSAFGTPSTPTAGEVLAGISSAIDQWTLTNAQQAVLLDMLASAGGVTALGETTDRLGRPVAGLSVPGARGSSTEVVLISRETGRIVGLETTNLVDEGVYPVGAIVGYHLWDVPEEVSG